MANDIYSINSQILLIPVHTMFKFGTYNVINESETEPGHWRFMHLVLAYICKAGWSFANCRGILPGSSCLGLPGAFLYHQKQVTG